MSGEGIWGLTGMGWVPGCPTTSRLYSCAPDPAYRFMCGVTAEWPWTDEGHPGTVYLIRCAS